MCVLAAACTPAREPRPAGAVSPEVEAAFLAGDFQRVIARLEPVAARPATAESAPALLLLGRAYMGAGRHAEAERTFRQGFGVAKDPALRAQFTDWLARAAFAQGFWSEAAARSDDLSRLPDAVRGAAVAEGDRLYFRGLACARAGRWEDAVEAFGRVVTFYRDGAWGEAAVLRRAVAERRGYFVQVGVFGEAARAMQMEDRLRGAGWTAQTLAARDREGVRHVVVIGPYPTYEEARAAEGAVRASGFDALAVP
jgi:hypothetical protein